MKDIFEVDDITVDDGSSSTEDEVLRYNITSYGWDSDVDGLVKRLKKEDIVIPKFQRKFVWNNADKSRFIESLILGLPVPSIFLSTDPITKKLNIIDGQQRLLSLKEFFDGEFALNASDLQDDLKNLYYTAPDKSRRRLLEDSDRRTLENAIIHAVIIKEENVPTEEGEYNNSIIQIFKRLNTTGKALQAQEVRACVFHGSFNDMLGELNQNKDWREIFGDEHSRLKDVESILRVFALYLERESYKSPMPKFLNKFMEKHRFDENNKIDEYKNLFEDSITILNESLGPESFKNKSTFLLSRFDSIMVATMETIKKYKYLKKSEVKKAFNKILYNEDYLYGVEEFTNDQDRIERRIKATIYEFENAKNQS